MGSFAQRIALGTAFEAEVLARLEDYGWTTDAFGQGQLSERQRKLLRFQKTPIRWMPDLIATRIQGKDALTRFVDAKAGETFQKTGNHDIETASLDTLVKFQDLAQLPVVVVTKDWKVHPVYEIASLCWDGPYRGSGSGTPFKLWPANGGIEWDQYWYIW